MPITRSARTLALALPAILVGGCGDSRSAAPTASIHLAAASDLQKALPILASRYKLDTGVEVRWTIGASGTLAEQIKQGAPYDLFLSANKEFVDKLANTGEIETASVRPYARGTLALVVAEGRTDVRSIADLARPEVRAVTLANPSHAPYGLAAEQALIKAGLWEKLEPKRVLATNVREALQFVESGDADAGFVGTAAARGAKVKIIPVSPDDYEPIVQYLGVVRRPGVSPEAERFAAFLTSETGRGILSDMGFSSVPAPAESGVGNTNAR